LKKKFVVVIQKTEAMTVPSTSLWDRRRQNWSTPPHLKFALFIKYKFLWLPEMLWPLNHTFKLTSYCQKHKNRKTWIPARTEIQSKGFLQRAIRFSQNSKPFPCSIFGAFHPWS